MAPSAVDYSYSTETPVSKKVAPTGNGKPISLLHRSLAELPHLVESASGSYMTLSNGRKILDGCGGAAVACIGHQNLEVIAAVVEQMSKVSYVHTLSYSTDSAENLARILLDDPNATFKHGLEKAFFVGSGSEANDAAMKLARQYFWEQGHAERKYFVARQQAYHGNTVGSMSLSSNLARKVPYDEGLTLPYISHVSPAYAYQYQLKGETEGQFSRRLVDELEREFLRLGPEKVVAFVAEPVVGATAGCVPSPLGYFKGVRAVCDKYGILLILDEIMCGMGRTGTYFAFEQEQIDPDIVTIGKGLSGGYAPIAAILIHKRVIDVLRKGTAAFNHGQTYQAHPVTCAAALKVQEIVRRDGLVAQCAASGRLLEQMLQHALASCKYVGDIRGRGLFWAVEFVRDKETKKTFDPSVMFGPRIQQAAFELGVALYPGAATVDGTRGDHVIISPAYNSTPGELKIIVNTLREAYLSQEQYFDGLQPSN